MHEMKEMFFDKFKELKEQNKILFETALQKQATIDLEKETTFLNNQAQKKEEVSNNT